MDENDLPYSCVVRQVIGHFTWYLGDVCGEKMLTSEDKATLFLNPSAAMRAAARWAREHPNAPLDGLCLMRVRTAPDFAGAEEVL